MDQQTERSISPQENQFGRCKFRLTTRYRVVLVALLLAMGLAFTGFAHVQPAQAATTVHGCPVGYACIYPENAGWNNDHPSLMYYHYGAYNLHNQFGTHNVFNNQIGWIFQFCWGSNATNCVQHEPGDAYFTAVIAGQGGQLDLTPYNSVYLADSPIEQGL